ncbi:hypothetical protein [Microbacterium gilvum]|uniref:Uncharacterized protein n=1 Tax=Microbacterium gilvum TaxID=1336204 RepID=A0ABP9A697_9MICO
MRFTKPGTDKTVTVANPVTVTVLEQAGWVGEEPEKAPVKRGPGRPKKSE